MMLPAPDFDILLRPLRPEEQNALRGSSDKSAQTLLDELDALIRKGTEEEKKAASDLMCVFIQKMLVTQMLDSEHGSIPEFVQQIEGAVEFYDSQFS